LSTTCAPTTLAIVRRLLAFVAGALVGGAALAAAGSSVTTGLTTLESVSTTGEQGNLYSYGVAISGSGRYVVTNSHATNLVPGDTNDRMDVFVRDRQKGITERGQRLEQWCPGGDRGPVGPLAR
jgi:hypothetical protein